MLPISCEFGRPEIESGFRGTAESTAMGVPETSMDENRLLAARKDEIGLAGQILSVKTVTIAEAVQQPAYRPLGTRVFASDGLHDAATLLLGTGIRHSAGNDTRWTLRGKASDGDP